jgi:itaconate CoA-transferase
MRPLDGVTVVSLEQAVAAPFCTRQLADYGARVIKIERPGDGDFARHYDGTVNGLSSYFVWLNRSKESVTLDLKQPAALEIMRALVERADILVQNLGPGAAARLGFDFATLAPAHPRLIVIDISGYGDDGPFARKKAYDLLVQAEAGLVSVTGTTDAPSRCGVSIADIAAGMYAFSGALLALRQRDHTDRGTRVDVTMLEAVAEWMSQPLYFGEYGGTAPPRSGASHPTIAPYGPHRAGDGREVLFGIQNEREWGRFCADVLEQPGLATDERFAGNSQRVANRGSLTRVIEASFAASPAHDVVARLDQAGIANGRVNDVSSLAGHEQLAARKRWRRVGSGAGDIDALVPPVNITGADVVMADVPAVGQHTHAVLAELGYDTRAVQDLQSAGAI